MKSMQAKAVLPPSSFDRERTQYEELIEKLSRENQMLRKQLESLADLKKHTQDIHRAETKEDENSSVDLCMSQRGSTNNSKHATINSDQPQTYTREELIRENRSLRDELDQKTRQYEQKMQLVEQYSCELTEFLNGVKQKQGIKALPSARSDNQFSNSIIVDIIESMIEAFQKDRSAFISKIEQLLKLISAYEQKEKEHLLKERRFQVDLRIAHEQVAIFKRLKKIN